MAAGKLDQATAFHLLFRIGRPGRTRSPDHPRAIVFILLFAAFLLTSCGPTETVVDIFREPPESPHEAYVHALEDARLHGTALGIDWMKAASDALHDGPLIELPYLEEGFFPAREPGALGYRFLAERGERIIVELVLDSSGDARIFTDLFRGSVRGSMAGDDDAWERLTLVAAGSSETSNRMEYSIRRSGEYTLRIQPELLRGGRYRITINSGPSLAFPVMDGTTGAIRSFFGAERDGGRREHHGVDIFAPRGTPVLAAFEGEVHRVGTNDLGGKVVWMRDDEGHRFYYAHLDSQYVRRGQRVIPGDTLGFVGNTGNARTTPPHLHFGIYARGDGPVDPFPFLREGPGTPAVVTADPERYGKWARVTVQGGRLRQSPGTDAPILDELDQFTPVRLVAGSGDWYRVRLPDGRSGYISSRLTEPAEQPLRRADVAEERAVQEVPDLRAPVTSVIGSGSSIGVLGHFGDFLYVQPESGPAGWISNDGLD